MLLDLEIFEISILLGQLVVYDIIMDSEKKKEEALLIVASGSLKYCTSTVYSCLYIIYKTGISRFIVSREIESFREKVRYVLSGTSSIK